MFFLGNIAEGFFFQFLFGIFIDQVEVFFPHSLEVLDFLLQVGLEMLEGDDGVSSIHGVIGVGWVGRILRIGE